MVKSTPEYIQSSHLHMEYMEWFIHTGLFGLLLLFRLAWGMIQERSENKRQTWWGVAVLLCASLVDFLQLNALALLFVIALSQSLSSATTIMTPARESRSITVICALIAVSPYSVPTYIQRFILILRTYP